ncbi:MAG TPA: hypothetical protein EYN08_02755 [Gammaproteobacteria bacterium]|jgi:hypothetical protein|nr:hypothetical protein [Gammaproteobacteria bacterium]
MINLPYLKQEIVDSLRVNIKENLELYRSGSFDDLLKDGTNALPNEIQIDDFSLNGMHDKSHDRDVQNSILIFNSIAGMTPYLARDERVWSYLTHTSLLKYTRERWTIPEDDEEAIKQISLHFFSKGARGYFRYNAAARLWWSAYLSNKVEEISLEDALNVLFDKQDVRGNIIDRPTVSVSDNILSAVIEALSASSKYDPDKTLFDRNVNRASMKELNFIAGAKLLQVMPKEEVSKIVSDCFNKGIMKSSN